MWRASRGRDKYHGREIFSMNLVDPAGEQAGASIAARILERLSGAFRARDWDVVLEGGDSRVDLVASKGRSRYAVEVKAAREPRKADLEGALANAILQAKAAA